MKVYLKYSFILEPTEEWRSRDDFDGDLMKFFEFKGFKSEVVKTALEDAQDIERMIYLVKVDPSMQAQNQPTPRGQKTPRQVINDLMIKKRDITGKFQKEKSGG